MADRELFINAGEIYSDLIAGDEAYGGQYDSIMVSGNDVESALLTSSIISAGGCVYVSTGGVASNISVGGVNAQSKGFLYVSGGVVGNVKITNRASMYVSNGGVASNVTISGTGATVWNMGGLIYNGTLSGGLIRLISAGLRLSGGVIYDGAIYISANALASDVTVSGGELRLSNGGRASGAVVYKGTMTVSGGALVSGVVVHGGAVNVSGNGQATNVDVNLGGTLNVEAGGAATVAFNPWQGTVNPAEDADVTYLARDKGVYYGGAAKGLAEKDDSLDELTVNAGYSALVYDGGEMTSTTVEGGNVTVSGGALTSTTVNTGNLYVSDGTVASTTVNGGSMTVEGGAVNSTTVAGGVIVIVSNGVAAEVTLADATGNSMCVSSGGKANSITLNRGIVYVSSGGKINSVTLNGGSVYISGGALTSGTVNDGRMYVSNGGAIEKVIVVAPADSSAIHIYDGTATSVTVSGGRMAVYTYGKTVSTTVNNNGILFVSGGEDSDTTVNVGGRINVSAGGRANRTILNGGTMYISAAQATSTTVNGGSMTVYNDAEATSTTVSGGSMIISSGGKAKDTTIVSGGYLRLVSADTTEGSINLNFASAAGCATGLVNNLASATAETTVYVKNVAWGEYTYRAAVTGSVKRSIEFVSDEFSMTLTSGGSKAVNPFEGYQYAWNGTTTLTGTAYSFTATTTTAAALLAGGAATINGDDLAIKWTDNTTVASSVYLADGMTTGNAWLEIEGTNVGSALYGAAAGQNFTGAVNLKFTSGSIRNLAAGAANGGTVKAVNFTMTGGELAGAAYAGGFGSVTETIKTTITAGTLAEGKDFYAGALANYAKTNTATTVGDISLTIANGTFGGNIYGASAVKASVANAHTAGNVSLSITGGETTKGDQACIFAGGYATGSAATTTTYTVGNIDATVSGGSWGEAGNGRGFFGGIMASGVAAQVIGSVNITISGDATMGNVYGGGWAQKGGKSVVGDVNISIERGTITNLFGGGSHSTSGGTTETGDVTITVSGGNITGAIFARGQLDGDTTGAANVIFTGATNFGCDVFGYSYVGGGASDATLSFSGYTGTLSGNVGGFDGITLDGSTAMTLSTESGNVSNGTWEFDFTDRADELAGTSLLVWNNADFENDTIKVTFADNAQAQGGWNIATVAEAFYGTTFEVEVDGDLKGLVAYGTQIADGEYQGWGFELESGVLKFKNLA